MRVMRAAMPGALAALVAASLAGSGATAERKYPTWSATTWEAASSAVHKKVLERGKQVTITGEVIDVSCYMQLGKRGEAHIPCGTKCIEHGEPIGLVDRSGKVYVLFAEQHHPRRDGQTNIRSMFLPHLATTMSVPGVLEESGGQRALFVSLPVDSTKTGMR